MSRLFAKIRSDIRAETGVRASDRLETDIFFNFDGRRDDEGSLNIVANHEIDRVVMTVSAKSRTATHVNGTNVKVIFRKVGETVVVHIEPTYGGG